MTFEWDPRKARANLKKHHVDFDEAASVFLDPLATTYPDPADSSEEHREITVGYTIKGNPVLADKNPLPNGRGSSDATNPDRQGVDLWVELLVFVSHCERGTRMTRAGREQYEDGIDS